MIPSISHVRRLSIYRDGGSLGVSFGSMDGEECTLQFPINCFPEKGESITLRSYKSPIIKKYTKSEYFSPTTGLTIPRWEERRIDITWDEARELLALLDVTNLKSNDLWIYDAMKDIAANEGAMKNYF